MSAAYHDNDEEDQNTEESGEVAAITGDVKGTESMNDEEEKKSP